MDLAIWSTLPTELVQLIFARLPVAHIFRLSVLSKEWKWNVTARESKFRQVCSEAQSKLFGIICEGDPGASFLLRFYDTRSQQWHTTGGYTGGDYNFHTMGASDGGLVCCVERMKNKDKNPLLIVVCNPLTQIRGLNSWMHHALPDGSLTSVQPSMVQLVMDRGSQAYKVIVVDPMKPHGVVAAEVYHSASDAWTSTESLADSVFGDRYEWEDGCDGEEDSWFEGNRGPPCVFDCAAGQLLELIDDSYPCAGKSVIEHVLLKNRLFVLHALGSVLDLEYVKIDGSTERICGPYYIAEYQGQKTSPNWIKLRDHWPTIDEMFTNPTDKYYLRLYACEGLLLVTASVPKRHAPGNLAQFCDLATGKWHNIPALPEEDCAFDETMVELQWDALP